MGPRGVLHCPKTSGPNSTSGSVGEGLQEVPGRTRTVGLGRAEQDLVGAGVDVRRDTFTDGVDVAPLEDAIHPPPGGHWWIRKKDL